MHTREPAELPPFATGTIWAIAASTVALLLLVAARDGYHRDELYFLEASKHLAWGYVDQPPISVALVDLSHALFGNALVGLRLFPALADGVGVVLTALIARELGGSRFAQALSAIAIAFSAFLIAAHLAGPTVYDLVGWSVVSLLVIRILRTGKDRLWFWVGVAAGVALLDKETILFLLVGLAVGFLVNRQASVFLSRWLWAGAAIALLIWSPNLVWQASHGWPTVDMSRNLQQEHSGLGYVPSFVAIQLLLPGWWTLPVWLAGLWALWRERRFASFRAFAVAYVVLFALLLVFIPDRPYYLAPLYVVLLAAGAIVTEGVVDGARRFFSERPPRRRVVWRSRRFAFGWVLLWGVLGLPVTLPILSPAALANVPLQQLNYNLGETIGWPSLVATVAGVYGSIPPSDRASVAIVTANYGEAGAIDRYGPALGLPAAFSGHNSFWSWGPPGPSTGIAIVVGYDLPDQLRRYFGSVTMAARIHNAWGVQNDEEGEPIWLCREQKAAWPAIWPDFKHYG